MSTFVRSAVAAVIFAAGCQFASAQDQAPAPQPAAAPAPAAAAPAAPAAPAAAAPTAPAAQSGPKVQKFQDVLTQWKKLLGELMTIREEYATADDAKKQELKTRYVELADKAQELYPTLSEAVEEAYEENPANKEMEDYMLANCRGNFKMDNYEEAYRLGEVLLKNKCEEKNLYNWTGLSACNIGQLDVGEKYLKIAAQNGTIGDEGKRFLAEMPYFKKAWADEQKIREAEAKANDLPRVLLKTNKGDIEIELFENEAPLAVANFISLVEKGFYNGRTFHRVLPGFMAQGGCPKGDGTGGPGYTIPCECYQPNHRLHFRGTLSMAHAGRDTGGSQFFLTFVPTNFLDGKHTAFGRVVNGMDVLGKIQKRDPDKTPPLPQPDEIIEAKVLRKRPHEYTPTKSGEK